MADSPDRSKKGIAAGLLGAAAAAYTAKKEHDYQEDKEKYGDKAERSKKEYVAGALAAAGLGYAAKKEVDHHKEENAYEEAQDRKKAAASGGYGGGNKPQESQGSSGYGSTGGGYGSKESVEESQGMSTKAKVGLALGAVAGIGAAVAGGVAIKKHYDKKEEEEERQKSAQGQSQGGYGGGGGTQQGYGTSGGAVAASSSHDNRVRYGSRIALKHNMTGRFLSFANHMAPGSSSSGQKLVYTGDWSMSDDDYWVVQGGNNGDCVQFGATIRLKHAATGHSLHSHGGHRAPCSGQQEVTAFGGQDNNDDWVVERWGGGGGEWLREEPSFSLRHVGTGGKLHSHEHRLPGSDICEVTCLSSGGVDENDRWRALW